jgi:hypothetical protein
MSATREIISRNDLQEIIDCPGLRPRTGLVFRGPEPQVPRSLFQQEAIIRGILTHGNHLLTTAHAHIADQALDAYSQIFPILAEAVVTGHPAQRLERPPLQMIIRDL